MKSVTRRVFLKQSGAVAMAALGLPAIIPARALGRDGHLPPSERLSVACIGFGRIAIVSCAYPTDATQVTAVCDVRPENREKCKAKFGDIAEYSDFREMLEKADVDVVHISTPDHWHAPLAIACAKAGKHVNLEKPMGVCLDANARLREVIHKTGVKYQGNTEQRGGAVAHQFLTLACSDYLGPIREIVAWCNDSGNPSWLKELPAQPVPAGLDWDLWLGPAPFAPYNETRCKSAIGIFHIYDYSVGYLHNLLVHMTNLVQWWADSTGVGAPVEYEGTGTISTGTPLNTIREWEVQAKFANGVKLRLLTADAARKCNIFGCAKEEGKPATDNGITFIGEKGALYYDGDNGQGISSSLGDDYRTLMAMKPQNSQFKRPPAVRGGINHDLIAAIKENRMPICDIDSSFDSDLYGLLSDIAIRSGSKVTWNPQTRTAGLSEAGRKLARREWRQPWHDLVYSA